MKGHNLSEVDGAIPYWLQLRLPLTVVVALAEWSGVEAWGSYFYLMGGGGDQVQALLPAASNAGGVRGAVAVRVRVTKVGRLQERMMMWRRGES